jgi:hypothetical protein
MFMLDHRHPPEECPVVFASWRGFESPLRHDAAFSSCAAPEDQDEHHRIWWTVDAVYVAERTEARAIGEVRIP